jgi:anaerobic selenocysteine-containing dehydrogenase
MKIIKSTCGLCPIGCGILVYVKDGKALKVEGDPENPLNKGSLCPKGLASLEYLYHSDRLRHPLKRKGVRGSGDWEQITWYEALDTIANQFQKIKDTYGAPSVAFIHGAAKGLQESYLARFANVFGSPNVAWQGHVCFVPRVLASRLTYGFYAIPDYDLPPACLVIWGKNVSETLPHAYERIMRAREKGTRLIVIDPRKTNLASISDIWLQPRPGSDLALALGILHIIIEEGLYNKLFIEKWATGFEKLKQHVSSYTPKKVEELTWIPSKKIIAAARLYSELKPSIIQWGNVIDHGINSFQTARGICILRAITGNVNVPGGDVKPNTFPIMGRRSSKLELWEQMPIKIFEKRVGQGKRPLPLIRYVHPQDIIQAILEESPYAVRAVYNQGGNPITNYSHAQRVYDALKKLDFLVVADQFMTPTAALADIVLPVTTYLEFNSIVTPPYSYPVMSVQQSCVHIEECRSDYEILKGIAERIGMGAYFWETENQCLDDILKPAGLTFDEFRKIAIIRGNIQYRDHETHGFDTETHKVELYSNQLQTWGYDPLPKYYEPPETPFDSVELSKEYPLVFTTWKTGAYRHSTGRQISSLRSLHPEPVVIMHPQTAKLYNVKEGDWIWIETQRGRIRQKVVFSEGIDPRVVGVDYAWWFPEKGAGEMYGWRESNVNMLTDDSPPYNNELGSTNLRGILCKVYK